MAPAKLQKQPPKRNTGSTSGGSKKAFPDLSSNMSDLSLNSQKRPTRSWVLVALTVKNTYFNNNFMIGDFAGIKYHLNQMGVHESYHFWSTIDLSKYCQETNHKDIKIRGEFQEKVVYSSLQACHRQDDYTLKSDQTIMAEFISWMKDKAREAESGDVVNVILVTHGNPYTGGHQFGTNKMAPKDILQILKAFRQGVQVNIVSNACGSGMLCKDLSPEDQQNRLMITASSINELTAGTGRIGWEKAKSPSGRFRSSYFTDVIIKSLGKIRLDKLGPTISELGIILEDGVYVKPSERSTPMMAGSAALEAEKNLATLLHLDYVDFPLQPNRSKRLLRQESEVKHLKELTVVDSWGFGGLGGDTADAAYLKEFFQHELSKIDEKYLSQIDQDLHTVMETAVDSGIPGEQASIPEILRAIILRAKIQSAFFTVFMFLEDARLVGAGGLLEPMQLPLAKDQEIADVCIALSSFEFIQGIQKDEYGFETFFYPMIGFSHAVTWLATLIVRGAIVKDLWVIMDRISSYGEFGSIDRAALEEAWAPSRLLNVNRRAGVVPLPAQGQAPTICFWLPHSMGTIPNFQDIYRVFDDQYFFKIEDLLFKYWGMKFDETMRFELLPAKFIIKLIEGSEF